MAIHCEPVSEPPPSYASFETRWIAASLPLVTPRNDRECVVIARAKSVAIHCQKYRRISWLCYKKRNDVMRILHLLRRNTKFLLLGLFYKMLNYKAIGNTQGNMAREMPNEIGPIAMAVEKRTNPDHESIIRSAYDLSEGAKEYWVGEYFFSPRISQSSCLLKP